MLNTKTHQTMKSAIIFVFSIFVTLSFCNRALAIDRKADVIFSADDLGNARAGTAVTKKQTATLDVKNATPKATVGGPHDVWTYKWTVVSAQFQPSLTAPLVNTTAPVIAPLEANTKEITLTSNYAAPGYYRVKLRVSISFWPGTGDDTWKNTADIDLLQTAYDFIPIALPEDEFNNRSYASYGVGESLNLEVAILPIEFRIEDLGGLMWTNASPGVGSLTNPTIDGTARYKCSYDATIAKLRVAIATGPDAGKFKETSITTVEPSAGDLLKVPTTILHHVTGQTGVGWYGYFYLLPKNVSFKGLTFKEGLAKAVTTGYYLEDAGKDHDEAPHEFTVGDGNATTGSRVIGHDWNSTGDKTKTPYAPGTIDFDIPWLWKGGAKEFKRFDIAKFRGSVDDQGKATLSKYDTHSAEVNDVFVGNNTFAKDH